jgi:hypothetical protein
MENIANKYQKFCDFLDYLEYRSYSWDDVGNLMTFYTGMALREREMFNAKTPKKARFSLLNSATSKSIRIYDDLSDDEKDVCIKNFLYFVCLDNFDYDYRETIRRVLVFFERSSISKKRFDRIWAQVRSTMPVKTQSHIDRLALHLPDN